MESPGQISIKSAQVWRKIKCDGTLPACSNCIQVNETCAFSTQLRRKTKRRGHDPKNEEIQKLQNEIVELRQQLKTQTHSTHGQSPHAHHAASSSSAGDPQGVPHQLQASGRRSIHSTTSRQTKRASSGPIFRHLGRLVCAEDGVDQFAGSSTGVHFTLSAQMEYQALSSSSETFPEAVFSLHLLKYRHISVNNTNRGLPARGSSLRTIFSQHEVYYFTKIDAFFENWSQLYPILAKKQFLADVKQILSTAMTSDTTKCYSDTALFQLYIMLAIEELGQSEAEERNRPHELPGYYYLRAQDLYYQVMSEGNLASLQSLLLLLLYYQLTTQHHLIHQTVGSVVRLSQSLGLHRHARRFRFCVGETEVRKRLWWCVYIFDVMTSLHYGLPKIIDDADDDNDLPVDCDFDDMTLMQLPLPLPGETTKMSQFLLYIKLAKILSSVLKELYTTTRRRNGVQKLDQLTRELQLWEVHPQNKFEDLNNEEHDYDATRDDGDGLFTKWLSLLGQIALIYVHRPALTYAATEPQFKTSLGLCARASRSALSILYRYRQEKQLLRIFPSGPNLIFQCALLCLFEQWHQSSFHLESDATESMAQQESLESTIRSAAYLLEDLQAPESSLSSQPAELPSKIPSLYQAAWVLKHLYNVTTRQHPESDTQVDISTTSAASDPIYAIPEVSIGQAPWSGISSSAVPATVRYNQYIAPDASLPFNSVFSFGNDLDYLNHMDESTWTFLSQLPGITGDLEGLGASH